MHSLHSEIFGQETALLVVDRFLGTLPPLNVSFQCAAIWLRLGDGVAHG